VLLALRGEHIEPRLLSSASGLCRQMDAGLDIIPSSSDNIKVTLLENFNTGLATGLESMPPDPAGSDAQQETSADAQQENCPAHQHARMRLGRDERFPGQLDRAGRQKGQRPLAQAGLPSGGGNSGLNKDRIKRRKSQTKTEP